MVEIDRGGPESASERCDDRIWYQTDGRYLGSETNVEGSYKWQLCRMFPCLLSLSRQLLTRWFANDSRQGPLDPNLLLWQPRHDLVVGFETPYFILVIVFCFLQLADHT